jgi:hypothetical protein
MKLIKYLLFSIMCLMNFSCDNSSGNLSQPGVHGVLTDEKGNPIADAEICLIPILPIKIYKIENEKDDKNITLSCESVELVSFRLTKFDEGVRVSWSTASEINLARFELERAEDRMTKLDFIKIYTEVGSGNSIVIKNYNYVDSKVNNNTTYYYRLKIIDKDSSFKYSEPQIIHINNENYYSLDFTPAPTLNYMNIQFSIPKSQSVKIEIKENVTDKSSIVYSGIPSVGKYTIYWVPKSALSVDTSRFLRPGIYTLNLKSEDTLISKQFLLYYNFTTIDCKIPNSVTKTDKDGKFFIGSSWFHDNISLERIFANGQIVGKYNLGDSTTIVARKILSDNINSTTYLVAQKSIKIDKYKESKYSLTTKEYIIKK